MNLLYFVPFTYAFTTRLRQGLAFHFLFEWAPAGLMVLLFHEGELGAAIVGAILSYIAFISLYEIGYLYNDLVASKREPGGRHRGPQDAGSGWLIAWCVVRIAIFAAVTIVAGRTADPAWWSFFAGLSIVFALHNVIRELELRVTTFVWLAWFRFMAPMIFIVADEQRLGIAFGGGIAYAFFRTLAYLDAKDLLVMKSRKTLRFRLIFFLIPLLGALALWPYAEARGFTALVAYFAVAASAGVMALRLLGKSADAPA